jgi:hypothetical protein
MNEADRLAPHPVMRWVIGGRAVDPKAASAGPDGTALDRRVGDDRQSDGAS